MRFKLSRLLGFIGFFVVFIFLLFIIFLNQIEYEISNLIAGYGYGAILVISFIVDVLAQPIGPEIPLFSGKLLGLNIFYVALLTIVGSITATYINYKVGGLFYDKVCEERNCKKYLELYQKYGKYGLFVSAIGPIPYVPFCWLSGAFGFPIRKFLFYGLIPRIIRIIVVSIALFLFF